MKKWISTIFVSIVALYSLGQTVETVISHSSITDGMCTDTYGNVYTTSGGLSGNEVGKYEPLTEAFWGEYIAGLYGPVGVAFLNDSILLITNYDNNTVFSHNINTMTTSMVSDIFDGPAGIVVDDDGYAFISNWGNLPDYAGNQIHKINTATGETWVYVESELLYRPQAITFNHQDTLIVYSNNRLYKINPADSTLYFFTDLGTGVGNMDFRYKDSCIYAADNAMHQILKITANGVVSTFVGSGEGYEDGDVMDAKFTSPLGITFSPGEDTLYIAEAGPERLRRIIMNGFTSIDEIDAAVNTSLVYPNPLPQGTVLHLNSSFDNPVEFALYTMSGELIYSESLSDSSEVLIPASTFMNQSPGSYIFMVTSVTGEREYQKLVIE